MQKSLFRKSLVCGILLLFIGLNVTSSISGFIGKMSNQSTEEAPTNYPLNNDYALAYWKFDEGSGNTAHDSSGHDYDGTIYGATWWDIGHSGHALDFDGVDDYVDLDAHSEDIGFNKTDDAIFSVWFSSTSTDDGLIYCMSDAWGTFKTEHRINLYSNGSLLFRVWVDSCGISVCTDGTYNDGEWHYLEIFFHGSTAKPTVELYVDNELDGSVTDWVCSFSADDFKRAKIGRRAYDATIHFDGLIDEYKIIKYPKGNKQNPPNISGPTNGEPGVEYDYTFITEDPEGDDIWLYIDWNDGTVEDWIGPYASGEEVIVSHEWSEDGSYEIKAKSKDIWDDSHWSDPYPVRMGNQAPDAPEITGPQFGDVGVEYEYTFAANDFEENDIYYYVDWGDGTFDNWFGPYPSGEEATATNVWYSENKYEITAKAKDAIGAEGDWSDPFTVRIGDQAPDVPGIDGPTSGSPGVKYEYKFTTTDPEGDNVYYWIEWGDGNMEEWIGPYNSGEEVTRSHTWSNKETYTIRAKAKDTFNEESDWATLEVTMPKNQQTQNWWFLQFLQNHPRMFPILRHLMGL